MVEEDDGPWGALVVLAEKPYQENVPWHEYQWRLCASYQKLNQVTSPLTLPIPCYDEVVQGTNTEENYFIAVDMGSGYWKVAAK